MNRSMTPAVRFSWNQRGAARPARYRRVPHGEVFLRPAVETLEDRLVFSTPSVVDIDVTAAADQEIQQAASSHSACVAVVGTSHPSTRVVISALASKELQAAADTFLDYIEQSTGIRLELLTDDAVTSGDGTIVQIGSTQLSNNDITFSSSFKTDGFVIQTTSDSIVIRGPTDWGTEFGVYHFLETYVGVSWLLPGPYGDDVPQLNSICVPQGTITEEPAFFSREFTGLAGCAVTGCNGRTAITDDTTWGRRNGLHGHTQYTHNLHNVIPSNVYGETNPEFFPIPDGGTEADRYVPPPEPGWTAFPEVGWRKGWNPCFTDPALVDEAVKNIVAYFDEHPGENWYSLGVNDGNGYCYDAEGIAALPPEENFLGLDDFSNQYYEWANQVIDGVLQVHPDVYFGNMSYYQVAAPPQSVRVHPRLTTYITYDRMKWLDPLERESGQQRVIQWQERLSPGLDQQNSGGLGFYDYLYGSPYLVPRLYFSHVAELNQFAYANGIGAQKAELYPNFGGEGPAPYVYLELWWDPHQDVDQLVTQWSESAVGDNAAPWLTEYYSLWEEFWTERVPETQWFQKPGSILWQFDPGYLEAADMQDIVQSRFLLNMVVAHATRDANLLQTERAEMRRERAVRLEQAFQYYEASVFAYLYDHQAWSADTDAQAVDAVRRAEDAITMAAKRRRLALEEFPEDTILKQPISIDVPLYALRLGGKHWGEVALWASLDWARQPDSLTASRLRELSESASEHIQDAVAPLLEVVDNQRPQLLSNGSFEDGGVFLTPDWAYWNKPVPAADGELSTTTGSFYRDPIGGRSGTAAVVTDAIYRGGPQQTVEDVGPGPFVAGTWVYVTDEGQESTAIEISLKSMQAPAGHALRQISTRVLVEPGQWSFVGLTDVKLYQSNDQFNTRDVRINLIADRLEDGIKVYWDDAMLYDFAPLTPPVIPFFDGPEGRQAIVRALQAGKYLTGEPATWEQGDWNRDGVFDQSDVIAALQFGSNLLSPDSIEPSLSNAAAALRPDNTSSPERFAVAAADRDMSINQTDIERVLTSHKYLTELPATSTEGDWNGDGLFNQIDIVEVFQATKDETRVHGSFGKPVRNPEFVDVIADEDFSDDDELFALLSR